MSELERLKGCVGDYRILWEAVHETTVYHRKPDPNFALDTVPAGSSLEHFTKHIIAPNETLARAAHSFKWPEGNYKLISIKPLLVVDLVSFPN